MSPTVVYEAPAKLNLTLRVVGRRADGYHLLETVMVYFPLYDLLTFELLDHDRIELTCTPAVTAEMSENLVYQAAQLLKTRYGVRQGVRIHVQKHIPHGAGLGGGSSDCATTLLALNQLWQLGVDNPTLRDIGVGLGADVPIFLFQQAALAEGIGEQLTPIKSLPDWHVVIVNPGLELSTVEVFKAHAAHVQGVYSTPGAAQQWAQQGIERVEQLENDLQTVAMALCPEVGTVLDALTGVGASGVCMSGSGATCFGVFDSKVKALEAQKNLQDKYAQWVVIEGGIQVEHVLYGRV
ncbi:4-(cytidine 5'-diphospho)-2-C-methyl-D-erythritol kinase [Magnetococcus sp. PR-3]|uniref:4-(cytidine 5'-diphospho)-2-C-methyl-D-erythritol kinase n=1 Tax=Magnetococcus sp. PR-3 TaxID=3120355 RepID=UPI002FCDF5C3